MIGRIKNLLKPLPDNVSVEKRKVKYARIQVLPSGDVRIVVPTRCTASQVYDLYQEKRAWVDRKLAQFAVSQDQAFQLKDNELLLFGEAYSLQFDTSAKKPFVDHGSQSIIGKPSLLEEEKLLLWYKSYAKSYFGERLARLAEDNGFVYNRLTIRAQKTRWGSCSIRKNISLNWKLIKTPVYVSDYVMLHELVHTHVMNHSPAFWQAVEDVCPDYKKAKSWLKQNGAFL